MASSASKGQDFEDTEEIAAISQAINNFGILLYKELRKNEMQTEKEENILFSPLSLSTVLVMSFLGTRNETAEEIKNVLAQKIARMPDNVESYFQKLLLLSKNNPVLKIAFAIVVEHKNSIKSDYKSLLEDLFTAKVFESNLEDSDMLINQWVENQTCGKITRVLESFSKTNVMFLLNVVYFKGLWKFPFREKDTFLQYFYNNGIEENAELVEMMHAKYHFYFLERDNYKVVQLPYHGDDLVMFILLPQSKNGLKELETKLTVDFIQSLKPLMQNLEIEIALPKFRVEYSKCMNKYFKNLGMNRVFNEGGDFDRISDSKLIHISEISYKAVLEVDEENYAATKAAATSHCPTNCPEFLVDHPFLFWITNFKNNVTYFMGKIDTL